MIYSYVPCDEILLRFTCLGKWIKGRTLSTTFKMANSRWGKRHHAQFLFSTWAFSVLSKFYSVNRYHVYKQKIKLNTCNSKSEIITSLTSTTFFAPKCFLFCVTQHLQLPLTPGGPACSFSRSLFWLFYSDVVFTGLSQYASWGPQLLDPALGWGSCPNSAPNPDGKDSSLPGFTSPNSQESLSQIWQSTGAHVCRYKVSFAFPHIS